MTISSLQPCGIVMSSSLSGSEQPLDPQAARLAAKVRLLMLVSALTTVLAVGAVLAVIGYRVFKAEGSAGIVEVTATLPKGARIISTVAAGDRITVTIQIADAIEIRTFDAKTLQPSGRLRFLFEP
jgi:heme/copper-type cytochrome/quinol oxidase subunit 2